MNNVEDWVEVSSLRFFPKEAEKLGNKQKILVLLKSGTFWNIYEEYLLAIDVTNYLFHYISKIVR